MRQSKEGHRGSHATLYRVDHDLGQLSGALLDVHVRVLLHHHHGVGGIEQFLR